MNKEEKRMLQEQVDSLKALVKVYQDRDASPPPPIIIQARCVHCGELTMHISHLARSAERWVTSTTTNFVSISEPLKTCLSCGLVTYKQVIQ